MAAGRFVPLAEVEAERQQLRTLAKAFRDYDEALQRVGREIAGESSVIFTERRDLDDLYAAIEAALPSPDLSPAETPPPGTLAEIDLHGLTVARFARLAEWSARMVGEHGYQLLPMTDAEIEHMRRLDTEHGDGRLETAEVNAWAEGARAHAAASTD
jgi:hypothetical protein